MTVEAVPRTAMFTNLRSILTPQGWDVVRRTVYRKAKYRCEVCGGKGPEHPVEAHEQWDYDLLTKMQTLVKCVALCPACHEVKHIGLASQKGRFVQATAHLMKVNGWDTKPTELYFRSFMVWYEEASCIPWSINIDAIRDYGLFPERYVDILPAPDLREIAANDSLARVSFGEEDEE